MQREREKEGEEEWEDWKERGETIKKKKKNQQIKEWTMNGKCQGKSQGKLN